MDFLKGRLVRSLAGRDKTRTFAVMAVDGQMLLLANGSLRTLARPKRKKRRHVAPPPPFWETSSCKVINFSTRPLPRSTRPALCDTLKEGNQLV